MQFTKIGTISGTNGLQGAFNIAIDEGYIKFIKKNGFVFIELTNQTFVPYQIQTISKTDEETAVISLEEFDSIELAKTINGRDLYLEKNQLPINEQDFVGGHLTDFELIDKTVGKLGKIQEIYDLPQQVMAEIIFKEKTILVPLIEEFIVEINPSKQFIKVDLPEGLLEI